MPASERGAFAPPPSAWTTRKRLQPAVFETSPTAKLKINSQPGRNPAHPPIPQFAVADSSLSDTCQRANNSSDKRNRAIYGILMPSAGGRS